MITASYKSTWCNSNPASMHKGGHHLWKSDSLPFKSRDSPHLKWRRFIIGWRFFIKLISRFIKIAFSKNSRYFKQLKARDSKINRVRFSQMVPSKRDDQIRLYASRKSSLQWVAKRDSGFPENHAVSRWSQFALAS